MSICTADAVGIHADSFCLTVRPWAWFHRYNEFVSFPWNYGQLALPARSPTTQNLLSGFGVWNLMFGIIVRCSSDRMALMILVIAAAPSL